MVGHVIKLDTKKTDVQIRICATVSNVVVSIDGARNEFALLRTDRYQLALLISSESDLCLKEKKNPLKRPARRINKHILP
jgi:hypothetical protein